VITDIHSSIYLHLAIQPPPHSNSWPVTSQSSWHSHRTSGATCSGCIGSTMPTHIKWPQLYFIWTLIMHHIKNYDNRQNGFR